MKTVCATLFAVAAMATAAVDLPWVYDTSERTFEDVKSVSAAGRSSDMALDTRRRILPVRRLSRVWLRMDIFKSVSMTLGAEE
jgi:hypothetical protein